MSRSQSRASNPRKGNARKSGGAKSNDRLYFAYGSNLWHAQMARRCPHAVPLGLGCLPSHRWIISARGYANVLKSPTDEVWGLVWSISPSDEASLDAYEGVDLGSYDKFDLPVRLASSGEERTCLVYVDPEEEQGEPWPEYVERMNRGLADAQLPREWVLEYVRPFIPWPRRAGPEAEDKPPARFYFAYGLDMWLKQLSSRAPGARVIDVACLSGYRWLVSARGFPNIVPSTESSVVYGVVSSISKADEERLDRHNGVPRGMCAKHWLDVAMERGRGSVSCLVYIDPRTEDGPPSEDLIMKMQQALWDANLPVEWVESTVRPRLLGTHP